MGATFQREITRQAAPADATSAPRPILSLAAQGDLIQYIVDRCRMANGELAGFVTMTFDRGEIEDLLHLATRLRRMAPYEADIRRLVVGR